MNISVSLLPDPDKGVDQVDVAVVIDVLRATSVMATALANGADRLITCREVADANAIADAMEPRPLLAGERACKRIDGFDLGNSPAEYAKDQVGGRTIVMTTTNGTAAIESVRSTPKVFTGSFLNLSSLIEAIRGAENVRLVCAGTDGTITAEDSLLAGALLVQCRKRLNARVVGDEASLAAGLWDSWFGSDAVPKPAALAERLRETGGGRNLIRVGYAEDLNRCAAIDIAPVVPRRVERDPTTFRVTS